ncbi:MAG: aminotransferase class I/II-fold pyridoxal phosphate-dependent enzyme [Mariprofundaceae bacterium]
MPRHTGSTLKATEQFRMDKHCQQRLAQLGDYPFTRLHKLLADLVPNQNLSPINAGAGEPRLPLPAFTREALLTGISGFSRYPSSLGSDALRQSIANWLKRRFQIEHVDAATEVLSANGTREALFAIAHALVNPDAEEPPYVLMPNPMYQIYLGAAVTAGATPYFMPCVTEHDFEPQLDAVPENVWENTVFIYLCSPSNPTGWVANRDYYRLLLELADKHDFYIVADECYSEIYWQQPPMGLLEACIMLGRQDFSRCLVMNSLSKRSALPGLRSGFIAGDAALIALFSRLRSYTGAATPLPLQGVADAAWSDETHVRRHLDSFQQSLAAFFDVWGEGAAPSGTFFIWLRVKDDEAFARAAYEQQAITLLPGRYLGTEDPKNGINPGAGFVRLALVDGPDKAAELAKRLQKVDI